MHLSTTATAPPAPPRRQTDRHRRSRRVLANLIGLVLITSACGTSGSASPPAAAGVQHRPSTIPGGGIGVFDGAWQLDEISITDLSSTPFDATDLANVILLLDVEDDTSTIMVNSNCHRRSGSYTLREDGSASITLPGSTTQRCDEAAASLEDLGIGALESVVSWQQEGDRLTLFSQYPTDQTPPRAKLVFRPAG